MLSRLDLVDAARRRHLWAGRSRATFGRCDDARTLADVILQPTTPHWNVADVQDVVCSAQRRKNWERFVVASLRATCPTTINLAPRNAATLSRGVPLPGPDASLSPVAHRRGTPRRPGVGRLAADRLARPDQGVSSRGIHHFTKNLSSHCSLSGSDSQETPPG